jgi:hypothetical protein
LPQQRQVGDSVLLEASLENATRAPMLLEGVTFLPTPAYTAHRVGGSGGACESGPLGCVEGGMWVFLRCSDRGRSDITVTGVLS